MKKFDPKVFRLGYVALATADIERTKEHYLETIGLTETTKGDDGSLFLSLGYDQHNIVLSPAGEKALRHVGFQLNPGIAVAEFAKQVRDLALPLISRRTLSRELRSWSRSRAPAAASSSSTAQWKPLRRGSGKPPWRRFGLDISP